MASCGEFGVGEDVCGSHGVCVVTVVGEQVSNNTELICVCDPGYFSSSEFLFTLNAVDASLIPCNTNENAFIAIYALVILSIVIAAICYLSSIRKRSQARRLVVYFLTLLVGLATPIFKLLFDDSFYIGEEVLPSVLFAILFPFGIIANHIFLNKYMSYQYKTLRIKSAQLSKKIKRIDRLLLFNSVGSVFGCLLFVATPFVREITTDISTELEIKSVLFRTGFLIATLNSLILLGCQVYLLQKLQNDVSLLVSIRSNKNKAVLNINGVKWASLIHILNSCLFVIGFVSLELIQLWRYFVGVHIILCLIASLVTLYFNRRTKAQKSRQTAEWQLKEQSRKESRLRSFYFNESALETVASMSAKARKNSLSFRTRTDSRSFKEA